MTQILPGLDFLLASPQLYSIPSQKPGFSTDPIGWARDDWPILAALRES